MTNLRDELRQLAARDPFSPRRMAEEARRALDAVNKRYENAARESMRQMTQAYQNAAQAAAERMLTAWSAEAERARRDFLSLLADRECEEHNWLEALGFYEGDD